MKWKIEVSGIVVFNMYLRIFFPQKWGQRLGIPFAKIRGFPKLSSCYVTNWDFIVQNVSYNC